MADRSIVDRALQEFPSVMPASMAAEVLGMRYTTYLSRLRSRKIKVGKGKIKIGGFLQTHTIDSFPWLTDEYRRRYGVTFKIAVHNYSRRYCKAKLKKEDCSPAEFLIETNLLIPGVVAQQLFGMNEKTVATIKRMLGLKLTTKERAKINGNFFRKETTVETPACLSKAQETRFKKIVAALRDEFQSKYSKKSKSATETLLDRMNDNKATSTDTLFICRGKFCNSSWPHNEVCFYPTTDTPECLSHVCKYCVLRQKQNKTKTKKKIRYAKHVSSEREEAIAKTLPGLVGKVPTKYLLELFGLTLKQYCRILVNCEVGKVPTGAGNKLLQEWRIKEELEVFEALTPLQSQRLKRIWQEDVKAYIETLRRKDEEDTNLFLAEMKRIETSSPTTSCREKHRCEGKCGKTYFIDKLFFPNAAGRYKFYCGVCHRRTLRPKVLQYENRGG